MLFTASLYDQEQVGTALPQARDVRAALNGATFPPAASRARDPACAGPRDVPTKVPRANRWVHFMALLLTSAALVACKKDSSSAPPLSSSPNLVNVEDLRAKAEQGDAPAQAGLARLYVEGQQLPADYKEAANWASKAAHQGVADGQYTLAMLIEAGRGGTNTEADAVLWYSKAAAQGHMDAQYSLALMHATGRGTPKNKEASVKWFRAAADQGLAMAQFNLAQRYQFGQGTPTNLTEAYKWFTLAARQGIPEAAKECAAIKGSLSPEQLAEAERGAAAFTVTKTATNP
jgi:TPR repeat protein